MPTDPRSHHGPAPEPLPVGEQLPVGEAGESWPTGRHDPLTVEGEIEQFGQLARGLRHNPAGRRRARRMLAGLVVVVVAAVALSLLLG